MGIKLSQHARDKIAQLRELGWSLTEDQVIGVVRQPDRVEKGKRGELIAQEGFDPEHVLRVPYLQREEEMLILTVYPGRRERYERHQI